MNAPDPRYDLAGSLAGFLPGIVVQRNLMDAAAAQYAANGYTPLTQAQAIACLTAANALDQPDMVLTPLTNPLSPDPTQAPYPPAPPAPIALDGTFAGTATTGGPGSDYPTPEILMNLRRLPDSNPSPRLLRLGSGNQRVVGG